MISHSSELSKMSILQKKTKEESVLGLLRAGSPQAQQVAGYADTLREILQQPATWQDTFDLLRSASMQARLAKALDPRPTQIVLTGSGSSIYIGECLAPVLQGGLGVPVQAIAAGTLLTHRASVLPPGPGLDRKSVV